MTTKKTRTRPLWDKLRRQEARGRDVKRALHQRAWIARILEIAP